MSPFCVERVFTVLCYPCLFLVPEPQGRAGYPPVAPKPSFTHMATGGAGPEEAGQGSPVVMKKMVPVQSSRSSPAASATLAQQGERQLGLHPYLTKYRIHIGIILHSLR